MSTKKEINQIDIIARKIKILLISIISIVCLISAFLFLTSSMTKKNSISVNERIDYILPLNELRAKSLEALSGYRKIVASGGHDSLKYITEIGVEKRDYDKHMKTLLDNKKIHKFINIKKLEKDFSGIIEFGKKLAFLFMTQDLKKGYEQSKVFEKNAALYEKHLMESVSKVKDDLISQNAKSLHFLEQVKKYVLIIIPFILLSIFIFSIKVIKSIENVLTEETQNIKENITHAISDLQVNTQNLKEISSSLTVSSDGLNSRSNDQIDSVQNTLKLMTRIKESSKNNTDHANSSLELSQKGNLSIKKGRESVNQMTKAMNEINESNQDLGKILEIIQAITAKTKIINNIVLQTKLLSFNAGVEAARSGEHGNGFSIVADETANLAKLSGGSAKDIEILITESNTKITKIIQILQKRVEFGQKISNDCVQIFIDIEEMNNQLGDTINEIVSSSSNQQAGVDRVVGAIEIIDSVTKGNIDVVQETLVKANEVSKESQNTSESIDILNQFIDNKEIA